MHSDPREYLTSVLNIIESNAVMRDSISWPEARADALLQAREAVVTADTYPIIEDVLGRLGDNHSFLLRPDQVLAWHSARRPGIGMSVKSPEGVIIRVARGGPAHDAGLRVGDTIISVNGAAYSSIEAAALDAQVLDVVVQRAGTPAPLSMSIQAATFDPGHMPSGRRVSDTAGLLELPGYMGRGDSPDEIQTMDQAYASTAQQIIGDLERQGVTCWVVDLRRNGGGNMMPMLLGVAPLIGAGEWFAFDDGAQMMPVVVQEGRVILGETEVLNVQNPYARSGSLPPVAVLFSSLTRSSGELTALAFRGLPASRSFGEPTGGVPTANNAYDLPDGARILLTVALTRDRTGEVHNGPLIPDFRVAIDWTAIESDNDPVVAAAVEWLMGVMQ